MAVYLRFSFIFAAGILLVFPSLGRTQACPTGCECKFNGTSVDVMCKSWAEDHLPVLSSLANKHVKSLVFANSHLDLLQPGAFRGLEISVIGFLGCQLSQITADLFSGVKGVREVVFQGCGLSAVPADALKTLEPGLIKLDLRGNAIRNISSSDLPSGLQLLRLDRNPFLRLSESSFTNVADSLERLYLHQSDLEEIPTNALKTLKKLRKLALERNKITELSAASLRGFSTTSDLFTLKLGNNQISKIDGNAFDELLSGNSKLTINVGLFDNRIRNLDFIDGLGCKMRRVHFFLAENPLECDCHVYNVTSAIPTLTSFDTICIDTTTQKTMRLGPWVPKDANGVHFIDGGRSRCTSGNETMGKMYDCDCNLWISYSEFADKAGACNTSMAWSLLGQPGPILFCLFLTTYFTTGFLF